MAASRNLLFSKKRWPLSKYFCLRTLGSREQPVRRLASRVRMKNRRNAEARLMSDSPDGSALNAPGGLEYRSSPAPGSNGCGQGKSSRHEFRPRHAARSDAGQEYVCQRSSDSLGNVLIEQGDHLSRKRVQASQGSV